MSAPDPSLMIVTFDDPRLSDARPPSAHKHPVSDVEATGTASSATFLRGDGTWSSPPSAPVSSVAGRTGAVTLAVADVSGFDSALAGKADLVDGKLLASQLPDLAITEFLGTVASQAAMLGLSGQRGDWCVRTDRNTQWILIADNPAVIGSWREMVSPASPVSSVAGRTGAVTLSKTDVGLSNVDNTSDANKPVSTAVSTELSKKAASDHTHTPASIGAEPAQWYGTQAQYDALSTKDPNRTYNVLEG